MEVGKRGEGESEGRGREREGGREGRRRKGWGWGSPGRGRRGGESARGGPCGGRGRGQGAAPLQGSVWRGGEGEGNLWTCEEVRWVVVGRRGVRGGSRGLAVVELPMDGEERRSPTGGGNNGRMRGDGGAKLRQWPSAEQSPRTMPDKRAATSRAQRPTPRVPTPTRSTVVTGACHQPKVLRHLLLQLHPMLQQHCRCPRPAGRHCASSNLLREGTGGAHMWRGVAARESERWRPGAPRCDMSRRISRVLALP